MHPLSSYLVNSKVAIRGRHSASTGYINSTYAVSYTHLDVYKRQPLMQHPLLNGPLKAYQLL